jgi:multidrug efflux pump subunit AcrA (membrane-fusion protein)
MVSIHQQDFLPPVEENDFLPQISPWTTLVGLFIVGAVAISIAVAAVTKYNITVKASATVRPTGELKIVQSATDGLVLNIFVKENQVVKKGDVIATLNESRIQTKKSQLQSSIVQSRLQLTQISVQIRNLDSQILAETERINRTIASAKAELSRQNRDYQYKQITTTAQVEEAKANVRSAQKELQKNQTQLKSAIANLKSTEASLKAAKSKQNRYQTIENSGAIPRNLFEETQLAVEQQEQAVAAQKATVEQQKQGIEQQKQAVEAAQARLQQTEAALNPTNAEVAIASERIGQEKASGEVVFANLKRERVALNQQQIQTQKQLERDISELQQIEKELKQNVITAPADGTILKLSLRNTSQTVRPGEEIAQIAPSNTPLVLKALVAASDIGKVKPGQKTQLRVSACPYPDYGTLKGVVRTISPDVITAQGNGVGAATTARTSTQGDAFYEVTIEPQSQYLGKGNRQCPIKFGMEGKVDIISKEETFLQFLLRQAKLITDL